MTKIYYFSSTGNSLWSAKKITQILSEANPSEPCELHNIGTAAQKLFCRGQTQKTENIIEADAVIFIFPSYAFGMPVVVRKFIKNAVLNTPYVASFVTYGSTPLGTLGGLRRILKKKKIAKTYFGRIPAVENYLALFGAPKAESIEQRSKMQKAATLEAARFVIERKENKVSAFTPFSVFVWSLFWLGTKIFYAFYQVGKNCNGCAVCEKVCPVSAIEMKNERPRFLSNCQHCQGCINLCPLRAIQFSRVRFGTPGYCHPDIKINELMK